MTEYEIERTAERRMDAVDMLLMKGSISQDTYDAAVKDIDDWAVKKYVELCSKRGLLSYR
jgi:hypothetical protein